MPKKNNKGTQLTKRVKRLEERAKAVEKTMEHKSTYYVSFADMDDTWGVNSDMAPRTLQGTEGQNAGGAGALVYNRIGNEINLRSYVFHGEVRLPTTGDGIIQNPNSNIGCRILIADNLSDDSQLTGGDLLHADDANSNSILSSYKSVVASSKRYKILYDKVIYLNNNRPSHKFSFKMKLPKSGRVIHYDQATGGGSQSPYPSDFNVSLAYFADVSPVSSNKPRLTYFIKTRFTDC